MKMIRKVVEETPTAFSFDVKCCEFLIKNFTGDNIYVSFGDAITDKNKMILIPADCWQRHVCRNDAGGLNSCNVVYVIGSNAGDGVEIECLKW